MQHDAKKERAPLETAYAYAELGLPVIPLCPPDHADCRSPGKVPFSPETGYHAQGWQTRTVPTSEEIDRWLRSRLGPKCNIGLLMGEPSGLVGVDIDGEGGEKTLQEWSGGDVPDTWEYVTGGGRRLIYRLPEGVKVKKAARKEGDHQGLELLVTGQQVVLPPSIHPSGRRYAWAPGKDPWSFGAPAPAPRWILDRVTVQPSSKSREPRSTSGETGAAHLILEGCRFIQYCRDHAETLSEPEWYAMITNVSRADGGVDLAHELSSPYPGYSELETEKKIQHALEDGEPHTCQYIQEQLGFTGCPEGGCGVKAPVGFATSPKAKAKLELADIRERVQKDPKVAYDEDVIGALAILRQHAPEEYAKIKQEIKMAGKGLVNLNDLEKAVKRRQAGNQKLRVVGPETPAPPTSLEDILPDLPIPKLRQPRGYRILPTGVCTADDNGNVFQFCDTPIIVTRRLRHVSTGDERLEVAFYEYDQGEWRRVIAPKSTLYHRSAIVALADRGLSVTSENAKYVVRYLSAMEAENRDLLPLQKSVDHLGWVGSNTFIPGAQGDLVLDLPEGSGTAAIAEAYTEEGTLEDWIEGISPLRDYPIAWFTVAAGFSAPLLKVVDQRVFIIHNWGPSRGGKTATLKAAHSIWGEPESLIASFNATKVGLERMAAFYSDLPLGVDERQVVGDKQGFVESLVYLLGLGKGKARGTKKGGLQQFTTWRTIVLTTGEEPLTSGASETGVYTRVLEIYGQPIPDETLARRVHRTVNRYYGTAGPVFIRHLINEMETDGEAIQTAYETLTEHLQERFRDNIDSHVTYAATVALGDYYAGQWVFGLDPKKSLDHAIWLAESALEQAAKAHETDQATRALEFLWSWIGQHGLRFTDDSPDPRYGFKRDGVVYIYPNVFEKALQEEGFSPRRILRDFAERGWIKTEIRKGETRRRFKVREWFGESMDYFIALLHDSKQIIG